MKEFFIKLGILYWRLRREFHEWKEEIWSHDLDEQWCCDGRDCMCGGITIREAWEESKKRKK